MKLSPIRGVDFQRDCVSCGLLTSVIGVFGMWGVYFHRCLLVLVVCSLLFSNEVVLSEDEDKAIKITHEVGKDAVLTCTVKDLGRRRVIWRRLSDPYPISVGTTRFSPSRKYRITSKNNIFQLTIKDIGLEDAGEYECRVSGPVYLADVISISVRTGSDNTRLLDGETELTRDVGSDVILPCHVENIDNNVVLWKNGRNDVISLRKKIYNGNRRMSVVHDTRTQWSLKIEKIEEEDFGSYTCMVNSKPVLTRTLRLINSSPAKTAPVLLKDTNFRNKVQVMEGESVTLVCNFHANPPAKVTWYKRYKVNGKMVKENLGKGNSYTLRSVSMEQSGDYVCYGRNGEDPSGKGKTRLTVKALPTTVPTTTESTTFNPSGPASPKVFSAATRTGQKRGHNVRIQCTAIGLPRPSVHWTRNGYRLRDNHKYKTESQSSGRHTVHSTLLVRSLVSADYGNYKCVGYNKLGLQGQTQVIYEL